MPLLELIKNVSSTVSPARGADFPEIGRNHVFEISPRRAEFGPMEDGLTPDQFVQDAREVWIGLQNRLDVGAHARKNIREATCRPASTERQLLSSSRV